MDVSDDSLLPGVVELLPLGVWIARVPGGEFVFANAAFREIMGMEARSDVARGDYAEPYGIRGREGQPYPESRMPFVRAIEAGTTITVDDLVIHRHDGRDVNVRATARPVPDGSGQIAYVVIALADITAEVVAAAAQQEAEQSLRTAQKREALGTLAGGIAHDFNNLLAAIRLIASKLALGEREPERRRDLECIEQLTDSAARLTRELLTFGDKATGRVARLDLGALVGRMVELIRRSFDQRLRVQFRPPADAILIDADASQLEQVVMNLAVNARDAMPEGGDLVIEVSRAGDEVVLEISDTGPGVPAELRERIFEPYFTTKRDARKAGAGLGLATVAGIVRAHGGRIDVLDERPHGARFRATLRGARIEDRGRTIESAPTPPARSAIPAVEGTILVVDDDRAVRAAARGALEMIGYKVLEASDGVEALALVEQAELHLDAVVLDLSMPRLDGRQTLPRLLAMRPGLPVLMTSGRCMPEEQAELLATGASGFLAKPFDLLTLSSALASLER